jgi:hypothetical protein
MAVTRRYPTRARLIADPQQKTLHADVFVQLFPMQSGPRPAHLKLLALIRLRVEQARKVSQGNGQLPAIDQLDPNVVRIEPDPLRRRFSRQRSHAISLESRRFKR